MKSALISLVHTLIVYFLLLLGYFMGYLRLKKVQQLQVKALQFLKFLWKHFKMKVIFRIFDVVRIKLKYLTINCMLV